MSGVSRHTYAQLWQRITSLPPSERRTVDVLAALCGADVDGPPSRAAIDTREVLQDVLHHHEVIPPDLSHTESNLREATFAVLLMLSAAPATTRFESTVDTAAGQPISIIQALRLPTSIVRARVVVTAETEIYPSVKAWESNRIAGDRKFLSVVQSARELRDLATLVELEAKIMRELEGAEDRGASGPRWRLVAVRRAIAAVIR